MTIQLTTTTNELVSWFQMEFPEMARAMRNSTHHFDEELLNPYHLEGDVWTHTMMVCTQALNFSPDNDFVRWSTLLHDIGKPIAREVVEDRKRVRFIGHEGISAFMSIDVLNKTEIDVNDKIKIFKIIALHGSLFNYIKEDGTIKTDNVLDVFKGERELLENLTHQVTADSVGRFWHEGRVSGISYRLPKAFAPIIDKLSYRIEKMKNTGTPQLTVLVGPPNSGKSTWIKENGDNDVVISRDNIVMEIADRLGVNYNDAWHSINNDKVLSKQIKDGITQAINDARSDGRNVIIDMTNMSKKSRRRWIGDFAKYDKKAITFLTGIEELKKRNKIRNETDGKFIPENVITQMCQRFSLPMYGEGFNEIEYVWS